MKPITSYSDLCAVAKLFIELERQGVLDIERNCIVISNSLWLSIADDTMTYEYDGGQWEDYKFLLFNKSKQLIVKTFVNKKDYPKFLANIKSRPSLFQKLFDWTIRQI